jgi:hypothetical protein
VLTAIDFDHQPGFQAGKVDDVGPDWDLTPEAMAFELFSA